jgi:pimeloyl-ACP methyl ester carboxylesterase
VEQGEPLSLVGISAGGILARELAREHPELVRQVITIVSPFRHRSGDDNRMARILSRVKASKTDHFQALPREEDRPPLPMPSASIYSKSDGLIDWRSCQEVPGERRDNIEVHSSHLGAGTNLAVALAVLNRLNQPVHDWQPFRPPLAARPLFPQHSSLRQASRGPTAGTAPIPPAPRRHLIAI